MNERMKILELLQDGKITAEQAEKLLFAIEDKPDQAGHAHRAHAFGPITIDKKPLLELRNIGSQVAAAVSHSLGEVKRSLEMDDWPFGALNRVEATTELTVPEDIHNISIDTKNGRIKATVWDEPYVSLHVRGQVKCNDLAEAKQLLEKALQVNQTDRLYQLTVTHNREVGGASVDVFVPRNVQKLMLKTHNGSMQIDSVAVQDLHVETLNGSVVLYRVNAEQIRATSHNGSIDVQNCVESSCRSVYARTHNGTIEIDGIASELRLAGSAKTVSGRVDISGDDISVDYDDLHRRKYARFERTSQNENATLETRIDCETHSGSVRIRA